MISGATFSVDRVYRYRLWRHWDRSRPLVAFCMLNPSTADQQFDDPTIRRCIGFARAWGCGGVEIVNIFALCATDPRKLRRARDPVGRMNDAYVLASAARAIATVIAWGARGTLHGRGSRTLELLIPRARLLALGTDANRYIIGSRLHSHNVSYELFADEFTGAHSHSVNVPATQTTIARTSAVIPYLQLLPCRKG